MSVTGATLTAIEEVLQQRRNELAELEAAAAVWRRVWSVAAEAPAPAAVVAPVRSTARRSARGARPVTTRRPASDAFGPDVLAVLQRAGEAMRARDVADRVPGADVDDVKRALRALVLAGAVTTTGARFSLRYTAAPRT